MLAKVLSSAPGALAEAFLSYILSDQGQALVVAVAEFDAQRHVVGIDFQVAFEARDGSRIAACAAGQVAHDAGPLMRATILSTYSENCLSYRSRG
mgnify:CR=1 FL=1